MLKFANSSYSFNYNKNRQKAFLLSGNANFALILYTIMTRSSKINNILILAALLLIVNSCKNSENDVIPDVYISFDIDLSTDIEFRDLNAIGNHVIVTSATNNWGTRSAGYDNNGIIVYRSLLDEFNAYDRTCPHDYITNNMSVKINVDFTSAKCPQCGTTYALSAFGTPVSGPGKYPLKNYHTRFDGRFISVWNP